MDLTVVTYAPRIGFQLVYTALDSLFVSAGNFIKEFLGLRSEGYEVPLRFPPKTCPYVKYLPRRYSFKASSISLRIEGFSVSNSMLSTRGCTSSLVITFDSIRLTFFSTLASLLARFSATANEKKLYFKD